MTKRVPDLSDTRYLSILVFCFSTGATALTAIATGGATNALLSALFCFNHVPYGTNDNQQDNGTNDIIGHIPLLGDRLAPHLLLV